MIIKDYTFINSILKDYLLKLIFSRVDTLPYFEKAIF